MTKNEFERLWETGTFEEIWELIVPALTDPGQCPICGARMQRSP